MKTLDHMTMDLEIPTKYRETSLSARYWDQTIEKMVICVTRRTLYNMDKYINLLFD